MAEFYIEEESSGLSITGSNRQWIGSALCFLIVYGLANSVRNSDLTVSTRVTITLFIAIFLYLGIGLILRSQSLTINITKRSIRFRSIGLLGVKSLNTYFSEIDEIRLHTRNLVNGIQPHILTASHICGIVHHGRCYDFYSSATRKGALAIGRKVSAILDRPVNDDLDDIEGYLGVSGDVGGE